MKSLVSRSRALGALAAALGLALVAAQPACSQTPPNTPVRTFERPERIDFVCMRIRDGFQGPYLLDYQPQPLSRCTPLSAEEAADEDSRDLREYHLYGLVTQTSRGEVAVADLTGGYVVDHDREAPSINFLTVGALPRDLAASPDGAKVIVSSAEVNKPALYAIDTKKMLGDWLGPSERTTLATWHSCALPSAPSSVALLFDEGFVDPVEAAKKASVAVLLPGVAGAPSKILTVPLAAFEGDETKPGELRPCPVGSVLELGGAELVPPQVARGPVWDDGVKYRTPENSPASPAPPGETASEPLAYAASCYDRRPVGQPVEDGRGTPSTVSMTFAEPLGASRATRFVKDGKRLYVADAGLPVVHVVDLANPASPKELAPLLTTSLQDPTRLVTVKDLAVSPATREYKRFLYAVDEKKGSLLVYDVTDDTSPKMPLTRPNAQSNPFEALDRIELEAPVVSVQFARHEAPLPANPDAPGTLCNPRASGTGATLRLTGDLETKIDILGPLRLRGIFALATLSNGKVITLDVDDWDAACRRPGNLGVAPNAFTPPQTENPNGSPYEIVNAVGATNEAFFPVSAPHRARSFYYLYSAPTGATTNVGRHAPELQPAEPRLQKLSGTTLPTKGPEGRPNPKMMAPTVTPGSDTVAGETIERPLGAAFSYEDPTVHVDQNWIAQYEGTIPSLEGALATIATDDDFRSLTFAAEGAHFCGHGVEDLDVSRARTTAVLGELEGRGLPTVENLRNRLVDYVEITDDLLPPTDPYWREDQACWTDENAAGRGNATTRFDTCNQYFDGDFEPPPQVNPEPFPNSNRHFPIVQAYDGKLVVSRFYAAAGSPRAVVPVEDSNKKALALAKCCFHNQAHFRVRAGMQWVTKGATRDRDPVQFLHHVTRGKDDRCVESCETRLQLLNARSVTVPYVSGGSGPGRNSALSMRNPMFAFTIYGGLGQDVPVFGTTFTFTTRGRFEAVNGNIAATSTAVSPRSMRYVGPLGQMAIIDGASQGLVLFDLRTVTLSRTTFY